MELVVFLAVIVGTPIVIVGGAQMLIWKLIGERALRLVAAILALISGYLLVAEMLASPVYGNKSGLVAVGTFAIGILMVENLLILCMPLIRRFIVWDKAVAAAQAVDRKV